MKHRVILLVTTLVFLISFSASIFPQRASADNNNYYYTNDSSYAGIQGPDPYYVSGQSATVTYQKADDSSKWWGFGSGIYVDINQPITAATNSSNTCYPAIQTSDKKYDGSKSGKVYEECGDNNKSRPVASNGARSISIGSASDNTFQSDQASQECQGQTGQAQQACQDGYNASVNGNKTEDQACAPYSGSNLTECQNAFQDGQNSNDDSCEASGGGFSLNWALCEVYEGIQAVVNWMFTAVISPLLVTTPICLPNNPNCLANNPNGGDTIYQIWKNFRLYGDIFLVIVLLVIVFGESISGGLIDAYTAKKVLPRLLAAGILLNLSIYFMAIMIDFTNIVGGGIGALITAPLPKDGSLFTISPGNITSAGIFASAGGAALLAGFTAVNVTGIVLLVAGLAITGLIAVLGVFFTLIIRQAIIIGLVLVSPVAFALWCLPNTESWFKRWWDTFFQMLLVYPMVVVLFAVADVMSYLTAHNGNGGSFANNVIAFMLLLIPLYLVPFTLRSSNRLMGAIHGAVSNVGKQLNAVTGRRAISGAGQEFSKTFGRTMAGNRFYNAPENSWRSRINKGLQTAVLSPAALRSADPRTWRGNLESARDAATITGMEERAKESTAYQAFRRVDTLINAANHGDGTEADWRTYLQDQGYRGRDLESAIGTIRAAKRDMGDSFGYQAIIDNAATGTGFGEGPAEAAAAIARTSHGNKMMEGATIAGLKSAADQARRFDISDPSFAGYLGAVDNIGRARSDADIETAMKDAQKKLIDSAVDISAPGKQLGGRGSSTEHLAEGWRRRLENSVQAVADVHNGHADRHMVKDAATGHLRPITMQEAQRTYKQTLAHTAGLLDAASSVAPENARILADGIMQSKITDPATGKQATAGEAIEMFRNDREFGETRREFDRRVQQQHAATAAAAGGAYTPGATPGAPPGAPGGP